MDFIAYVFLVFIICGLISLDSKIRRNYFKLVQLVDFVISLKDVCVRSLLILHYFSCLLFKYCLTVLNLVQCFSFVLLQYCLCEA